MLTFHQFATGLCSGLCGLCLSTGCLAQSDAYASPDGTAPCRLVAGQTQIDGVMQQITGRACLQPDGTWQIVEDDGDALAYSPFYYYDPWYWGPPAVISGVAVSFIFVDRFHHFHHLDHVHYAYRSNGMGMGARGGWHGGAPMHPWGGMSHGGGGTRRY